MAKVAKKTLDFENKGVEFEFEGQEPVFVALSDLSPEIQLHSALHGISQKLGDAYSSSKGIVADARAMFDQALDQLKKGEWRAARGEGESKPRTTELVAAVARIKNVAIEDVQKAINEMSEEDIKRVRSNDRVKAVIQIIRAEKAAAKLEDLAKDEKSDFEL